MEKRLDVEVRHAPEGVVLRAKHVADGRAVALADDRVESVPLEVAHERLVLGHVVGQCLAIDTHEVGADIVLLSLHLLAALALVDERLENVLQLSLLDVEHGCPRGNVDGLDALFGVGDEFGTSCVVVVLHLHGCLGLDERAIEADVVVDEAFGPLAVRHVYGESATVELFKHEEVAAFPSFVGNGDRRVHHHMVADAEQACYGLAVGHSVIEHVWLVLADVVGELAKVGNEVHFGIFRRLDDVLHKVESVEAWLEVGRLHGCCLLVGNLLELL